MIRCKKGTKLFSLLALFIYTLYSTVARIHIIFFKNNVYIKRVNNKKTLYALLAAHQLISISNYFLLYNNTIMNIKTELNQSLNLFLLLPLVNELTFKRNISINVYFLDNRISYKAWKFKKSASVLLFNWWLENKPSKLEIWQR